MQAMISYGGEGGRCRRALGLREGAQLHICLSGLDGRFLITAASAAGVLRRICVKERDFISLLSDYGCELQRRRVHGAGRRPAPFFGAALPSALRSGPELFRGCEALP